MAVRVLNFLAGSITMYLCETFVTVNRKTSGTHEKKATSKEADKRG